MINTPRGALLTHAHLRRPLLTGRREEDDEGSEEYFDDELFWDELGVSDEF